MILLRRYFVRSVGVWSEGIELKSSLSERYFRCRFARSSPFETFSFSPRNSIDRVEIPELCNHIVHRPGAVRGNVCAPPANHFCCPICKQVLPFKKGSRTCSSPRGCDPCRRTSDGRCPFPTVHEVIAVMDQYRLTALASRCVKVK